MKKFFIILTIVFAQFSIARSMDTSCSQDTYFNDVVIVPSSINAVITESDFPNETGTIGVTAEVSGNGNMRTFSSNFKYKKVGKRLELTANTAYSISTNATKEEFRSFFGLFPEITCVAR